MTRYKVMAVRWGGTWEGVRCYNASCQLYISTSTKEEAIQKWNDAFTEEQISILDMTSLEAIDVDAGDKYYAKFFKEGECYSSGYKKS